MSIDFQERRKSVRYDFPLTIEYEMNKGSGGNSHKAVTINISESGLCLYLFQFLGRRQEIRIKSRLPISSKTASICWVKKIDDGFFKAGLTLV